MSKKHSRQSGTAKTGLTTQPVRATGWKEWAIIALVAALGFGTTFGLTTWFNLPPAVPTGMVLIPAGEFVMGTSGDTPDRNEQPAHTVRIDSFFIDTREVDNRQFQAFVEATGHVTTAEKMPDWEELKKQLPPNTPRPPDDKLVAGSMVFTPPAQAVPTDDAARWWSWTPGANWRHPEGPGSNLEGREDHPVVQVSWFDAVAYAGWAKKRLPTEAEWEYAARGGLAGKRFTWGDTPPQEADKLANIWHGDFPWKNERTDGWDRTSPGGTFPPNGYGLSDMAGNTWEWCADWYRADAYATLPNGQANPAGPTDSWDPHDPLAPKRVTRGGSFLCHRSYCESYRPAARRGTSPDTGMSHIGFRCARSVP